MKGCSVCPGRGTREGLAGRLAYLQDDLAEMGAGLHELLRPGGLAERESAGDMDLERSLFDQLIQLYFSENCTLK